MDDFRGVWGTPGQSLVETDDLGNIIFGSTYSGYGDQFIEWRGDTILKDFDPNGRQIVFFTKLDPDGNIEWHNIITGTGDVILRDLVTDHQQNIIVLIESKTGFDSFQQHFPSGYVLIKMNPSAEFLWSQSINHSNRQYFTVGHLMSVTCNDDLILGGYIGQVPYDSIIVDSVFGEPIYGLLFKYDTLHLDGQHFPADTSNFFVASLDPDGNLLWLQSFEHPGGIELDAIDASGPYDIALLGSFLNEDWLINNTVLPIDTVGNQSKRNIFIMTISEGGEINWVRKYFYNAYPDHIARDHQGNLIINGSFRNKAYFSLDTIGNGDVYSRPILFKTDSFGNYLWGTFIANQPTNYAATVQPNANGEFYHTGSLSNLLGPILNKFDALGNRIWTLNPIESSNRSDQDLDLDPFGHLVLSGFFSGEFILGGHSLAHTARYCNYLIKFDAELDPQQPSFCEMISGSENQKAIDDFISIFPNPAYDLIRVEVSPHARILEIAIYDMNSQIMLTELSIETNVFGINTSAWPSGIYAMLVKTSTGQDVRTFALVK